MITFEHVTYTYPDATHPALHNVSFSLPEASFTLVVGASGAGKSTLLRCINGLVPHFSGGALHGTLSVCELNPVQAAPQVMCRHVGFVFQDPETQFVVDQVEDEIAFALENSAMPRQDMRVRVEEVLDLLDLAPLRNRRLDTLSGGERQRVAIAAALALRPHILVLDEPTSQLDPKSAEDVLNALVRLNHDLGLTIVLAEHRLERVLSFVDRIIYLPDSHSGVLIGAPDTVLCEMDLTPPLVTLAKALGWEPLPLTIKDGMRFARKVLGARGQEAGARGQEAGARGQSQGQVVIRVRGVDVAYSNQQVLRDVHIDVSSGQVVAVMGRNGAGKTTLLKALVGLVRPRRGSIEVGGRDSAKLEVAEICQDVGYLPQDPNALLFADTVREELAVTLRNHGLDAKQALANEQGDNSVSQALLTRLGLADKAERYPRDLSAGERQRVALAAIAVTQPGTLLLDEPTRGLDYVAKQELVALLHGWRNQGMAIVLVTHDVEFAAALADRVVLMSQGEIIADGPTAEIMGASPLFAPQVARLFPGSGWLTPNDAIDVLQ